VVLELDPKGADLDRLTELGYEVFTSVHALRSYAIRRNEVAAGVRGRGSRCGGGRVSCSATVVQHDPAPVEGYPGARQVDAPDGEPGQPDARAAAGAGAHSSGPGAHSSGFGTRWSGTSGASSRTGGSGLRSAGGVDGCGSRSPSLPSSPSPFAADPG